MPWIFSSSDLMLRKRENPDSNDRIVSFVCRVSTADVIPSSLLDPWKNQRQRWIDPPWHRSIGTSHV